MHDNIINIASILIVISEYNLYAVIFNKDLLVIYYIINMRIIRIMKLFLHWYRKVYSAQQSSKIVLNYEMIIKRNAFRCSVGIYLL